MREIKFRAWDETQRKMLYGDKFTNHLEELLRNKPMQYTGLKDKNGVEIYENDLVEYLDGEYSFGAVVEWGDYGWYMRGFEPIDNFHFDDIDPVDLKVIGNIYENPELLEAA